MTNIEKAFSLGILDDLQENHSDETIENMTTEEILDAWLQWEGIIGFTDKIMSIVRTFDEIDEEEFGRDDDGN